MIYIGIDNGVTGSIGIIDSEINDATWFKTPIKKCLNYTKKKAWLNRVDADKLFGILRKATNCENEGTVAFIERPLVNPMMFKATTSALRAFEATVIILEFLKIPYEYIDSKEWQKAMLPNGVKGRELKRASKDVATRLFPKLKFKGDGDGILIAEYARRKNEG